MSDALTNPNDPLHLDAKLDHVRIEHHTERGVKVFQVMSRDVYPRQSDEIHAIIEGAIGRRKPVVLLDLGEVRFICSAFLGRLINLHKQIDHLSGQLKIFVADEHVRYTMGLVGLDRLVEVGSDRRALLDGLRAAASSG
jgi:anti-anti-sigma factor